MGLTGGIASGKSEVSRVLSRLGATVVDADVIARRLVEPGSRVLEALAETFGPDVLRPDGSLDRAAVAGRAFASDDALRDLNAIVHPPLVDEIRREIEESRDAEGVLVVDAALLVEWDLAGEFDTVVVVSSPVELRVERLRSGGMTEEEARGRVAAQLPEEELVASADVVIENDGSLEELRARAERLWLTINERTSEVR